MNILQKKMYFRPLFSILVTLMAALAVTFFLLGFSAWYVTEQQRQSVSNSYTTVAIPYNKDLWGFMPCSDVDVLGNAVNPVDLDAIAAGAPVSAKVDHRVVLGAVVDDHLSCVYTRSNSMVANAADSGYIQADQLYNMSVFAVKCQSVEEESSTEILLYDDEGEQDGTSTLKSYNYVFSVEQTLCMADRGYPPPKTISAYSVYLGDSQGPAFQTGKTYLIRGLYIPETIGDELDHGTITLDSDSFYSEPSLITVGDQSFFQVLGDALPIYAAYEGEVQEFLSSQEGQVWENEVIPLVRRIYNTMKLVLTDNIDSIYQFNEGSASILEGRKITSEEYLTGADVCLISQEYASKNGLRVGDTVEMNLYHTEIGAQKRIKGSGGNANGQERDCFFLMDLAYPEDDLHITKSYTIVGIYTAPLTYRGVLTFTPDMIYAPKASVEGADQFEEDSKDIPFLNSIVIENGSIGVFEDYLKSLGWEGSFLYSDQRFSDLSKSLDIAHINAVRLWVVACIVMLTAAVACMLLVVWYLRQTIYTMRIIGVPSRECCLAGLAAVLPVLIVATLMGTIMSMCLFRSISQAVLGAVFQFPFAGSLIIAAFVALLLFLGLWLSLTVECRKKLMAGKTNKAKKIGR